MARRTPPRSSLGASALASLAIAGCGAAGGDRSADTALHAKDEQRLLSLIGGARSAASGGDGVAVDADLAQFIVTVNRLRGSGELTSATAASLDRRALRTEAQASQQLRPQPTVTTVDVVSTPASNPKPATQTSSAPPPEPAAAAPHHEAWPHPAPAQNPVPPSNTDANGGQNDQEDGQDNHAYRGYAAPGSGHGYGHGHGAWRAGGIQGNGSWGASGGYPGGGYAGDSGWGSGGPDSWSGGDRS